VTAYIVLSIFYRLLPAKTTCVMHRLDGTLSQEIVKIITRALLNSVILLQTLAFTRTSRVRQMLVKLPSAILLQDVFTQTSYVMTTTFVPRILAILLWVVSTQ